MIKFKLNGKRYTSIKHTMKNAYSHISKKNGKTYYLHARKQELKGGHSVTLHYFGSIPKEEAIDAVPAGYEVTESERTGFPMLRKISKPATA